MLMTVLHRFTDFSFFSKRPKWSSFLRRSKNSSYIDIATTTSVEKIRVYSCTVFSALVAIEAHLSMR